MRLRPFLLGLLSYTPAFVWGSQLRRRGTGGTDSARYCYSVWLRHLVFLFESGMTRVPKVVAELGPGSSIGIGLAALLSGCDHYNAFDVVAYASTERNVKIFKELAELFRQRADIPDESEFPEVKPCLKSYKFPEKILSKSILQNSLSSARQECISKAIMSYGHHGSVSIEYRVPWYDSHVSSDGSVDMIFSQAVLEHVDDLPGTYKAMYRWLHPDGFMSHQIDFKCHGTARHWNGHWAHGDFAWKLIRGRRPYLLNREPFSAHVSLHTNTGFKIVKSAPVTGQNGHKSIQRSSLADRFRDMSDADTSISSAHVVSVKG